MDETTPTDKRTPMEWILDEVIATRKASDIAAKAALETQGEVKTLMLRQDAAEKRLWLSTGISLIALMTAILAIVR